MLLRNFLILAIFAPAAVPIAAWPILAMTACAAFFAWRRRDRGSQEVTPLRVSSPVSLKYVLKFVGLFVMMEIVGTIGARYLGQYGFLALSLLGGTVSSASTTARGSDDGNSRETITGCSRSGDCVRVDHECPRQSPPLVERQTHDKSVTRTLTVISLLLVAIGLGVLVLRERF